MVTDAISNLIITLKNAGMVRKGQIAVPYTKVCNSIAQKLRVTHYVEDVATTGHGIERKLVVTLAYNKDGSHKVRDVKRVSKLGRRVYMGVKDLRPVKSGHGAMLLSTPKGILTDREARKDHVGGEALFKIW